MILKDKKKKKKQQARKPPSSSQMLLRPQYENQTFFLLFLNLLGHCQELDLQNRLGTPGLLARKLILLEVKSAQSDTTYCFDNLWIRAFHYPEYARPLE